MVYYVLHHCGLVCEHGCMTTLINQSNQERSSWALYAILGINLGMLPVFAALIANQL